MLFLAYTTAVFAEPMPAKHQDIKKTISFEEMEVFLKEKSKTPNVTITEAGKSVQGRPLYLVHINNKKNANPTKIFLFAQMHGNEVSSKDALLYLAKNYAENPKKLPADVDLWLLPMLNPDGSVKYERRNANNVDLNRDQKHLTQPESITLNKIVQKLHPDITVDCHEYTRNAPAGYAERGWLRYPDIMVDVSNSLLLDDRYYNLGLKWIEDLKPTMAKAGHYYARYYLGKTPPEGNLRPSNLGAYDGRNLGPLYNGIGFIIESAVRRDVPDPANDMLAKRVDAYMTVLTNMINDKKLHNEVKKLTVENKDPQTPHFIPVTYMWGNAGKQKITKVEVIDAKTKQVKFVETANFTTDRVVTESVATPKAYIIRPVDNTLFTQWLTNQAIEFTELKNNETFLTEQAIAADVKGPSVHKISSGKRTVTITPAKMREFSAGSLYVPVEQSGKMRVLHHLEPGLVWSGLFDPRFNPNPFIKLIDKNKVIPIERVMN